MVCKKTQNDSRHSNEPTNGGSTSSAPTNIEKNVGRFSGCTVVGVGGEPRPLSFPRIVWQTYRTKQLPAVAAFFQATWRTMNPLWNMQLFDDDDARRFLVCILVPNIEAFDQYPIGVMRADLWRYCVLFKVGGVYADIDTVSERPIESWLMGGARGLVVGVENGKHLAQWVFAAKPNHPALAAVITEVMRRSALPRCREGIVTPHCTLLHRSCCFHRCSSAAC